MDIDQACDLVRQTLILTLIVAAPLLVVCLLVGLVISLIQALTQIQEQTLVFVPKIVAMVLVAILVLPWMSDRLLEYAKLMFGNGPLP